MSKFPSALKSLRAGKGLTQAELAKELGIGKSTISMYEVGAREPDFETLEAIADFFNIPMAELLDDSVADEKVKAAFLNGIAPDLKSEEKDALWQDAKNYMAYKAEQMRKQKK